MGQLIQLLTELSCAGKHLLRLWGDRFCCHQGACECDVAADRDADVPLATGHPLAGASPCRFHWRQKHRRIGQCPSSPAMHRVRSCLELLRQPSPLSSASKPRTEARRSWVCCRANSPAVRWTSAHRSSLFVRAAVNAVPGGVEPPMFCTGAPSTQHVRQQTFEHAHH